MFAFSYYIQQYWLPIVLIAGLIVAITLVYKNRDKIVIRGSGRK